MVDVIKVIGFLTNNFGSDNIENIGSIISRYAYLTSYIDKIDRRLKPKLDYSREGKEWINSIYITVQTAKSKLEEYTEKMKANICLYYIPTLLLPFPYGGSSPQEKWVRWSSDPFGTVDVLERDIKNKLKTVYIRDYRSKELRKKDSSSDKLYTGILISLQHTPTKAKSIPIDLSDREKLENKVDKELKEFYKLSGQIYTSFK